MDNRLKKPEPCVKGTPLSSGLDPTRARHLVVVFAVTLAVITYIDRVCISQAAPAIRSTLGFGPKEMGWVFSSFTLAYALFEIPSGWMGDRFGPRSILMKVVILWSFFTAATGWMWSLGSMIVCRFLFGAGEAGCFPNLTKIFTIWLPSAERVRAQGILWLSARWGGAFTPVIVALALSLIGWRWSFGVFGLAGIMWAIWFFHWFRDSPKEHRSVNAAELAMLDGADKNAPGHAGMPWAALLGSGTVWLLWLQYFCMSYGWYFYITWLPTYLREARGMALAEGAILAGLPLFFGGIGCFIGGWLTQLLSDVTGNVAQSRRGVAFAGLAGAAVMLFISTRMESPLYAVIALGLASMANDLAMASGWGACMDVGGSHAGALSGSMNMMGNLGGAVGPVVVGYILESGKKAVDATPSPESWILALLVAAAVYAVGAFSWLFIDPVTPLEERSRGRRLKSGLVFPSEPPSAELSEDKIRVKREPWP
ncbi:MAG: MFS transporter [Candidatus Omnitrophica bacterium]|nr:MFS transporter [Candidatus Omnitrophota bacterium]